MRRATAINLAALLPTLMLGMGEAFAQSGLPLPGGSSRPGQVATVPHSAWVKGHNSSARLVAGAMPSASGSGTDLVAGVEIRLADGWKTYWRYPGDDGGLPPAFDWSGSTNLKAAHVLYPVPERQKSLNGTTLGYSRSVIFPVRLQAADPTKPIGLALSLEYGICREICIPAEARMSLTIEPRLASMPPDLATNLSRVPKPIEGAEAARVLKAAKAHLAGQNRSLLFDIATSGGGRTDLFVEAPGGTFMPVPASLGEPTGGIQRFKIDLKGVEDAPQLSGKPLRLTVTGPAGSSELTWIVK